MVSWTLMIKSTLNAGISSIRITFACATVSIALSCALACSRSCSWCANHSRWGAWWLQLWALLPMTLLMLERTNILLFRLLQYAPQLFCFCCGYATPKKSKYIWALGQFVFCVHYQIGASSFAEMDVRWLFRAPRAHVIASLLAVSLKRAIN